MAFTAGWNAVSYDGGGIDLSGSSRVFNVTWGDGASDRVVLGPDTDGDGVFTGATPVHFYASDGQYDVSVSQAQSGLPPEHLRAYMYSRAEGDITVGGTNLSDIITAGVGNDTLSGGGGNDVVAGGDGNDRINGGSGDFDFLLGGVGDDTVLGGAGSDLLTGNEGADVLRGGADRDYLYGDVGNDQLFGDEGDDYLQGDAGVDRLTGGAGVDEFVFARPHDANGNVLSNDPDRDVVADFQQGTDHLRVSDWASGFSYIGHDAFSGGGSPEIRSTFNASGDTIVLGDANGDGAVDFSVRLVGHFELSSGDFPF